MPFITDLLSKVTNLRIKIGDKLNTLKNQIGQLNSLTTNDKTSLVGAVNEVNNIEIGGRNLILNSQKYNSDSSIWYTPNSSIITPSVNGMIVGNSVLITPQFSVEFIDGEQYVISFDYMSLTPSRIEYNGSYRDITEGNRISFPFVFNKNKQKTTIYFNNPLPGSTCVISNIKLEKGNKATDWTPAPEDQVSDWNETDSTKHSFIKNKPTIPTVNNGELTLTTGTGLNGSTNFTANQAEGSTFRVGVANTHKLPTTAEWEDVLKKDESNTVTENFEITNGFATMRVGASGAIYGEIAGISKIDLGTEDEYAVNYRTDSGRYFSAWVDGISGGGFEHKWQLASQYDGESNMLMPITGITNRVLTTGAKIGTTTYYANTQGVIELPAYTTYTAGNGLTLSGTAFSLPVTQSGSGNVVSEVTQTTNGITVNKGISAMITSHVANSINQNLSKSSSPTFNSIELSAPIPYIDFRFDNSTEDYTSRITENSLGGLNLISKTSLKYNVDGATTPLLEIDGRGAIIGSSSHPSFESVYLRTTFGSLDFDDEGLNYRPKNTNYGFGISANINAYYDMSLAGKLNGLKIKGRGPLGSPTDLLTGNNLTNYLFGDVSNKDGLATFRVDNNITKDGGIPVFAQWGASILAQTGDTMFTLSADPNTPEIFVSAGTTTNNIIWNKKLAFSVNEFPLYAQAFYENSLRELKENIKPFNKSGIELINSLDIVTFDRKDSEVKNKIGIIADDSINEVLSTKKDAVDLYNTVFIQAKAIQELDSKNKTLEERISQLEEIIKNML